MHYLSCFNVIINKDFLHESLAYKWPLQLAFPKGQKYLCELCQKPAHKVCDKCRVTYYW